MSLYLKQLLLGPMENFVYLIGDTTSRKCLVVDPAWDVERIVQTAQDDGMVLSGILVTHYHPDHCGGDLFGHSIPGVRQLLEHKELPLHLNRDEIAGFKSVTGIADSSITGHNSGDTVNLGDINIKLIHTPGHTPGSQCFLVEDKLVSGDTLFLTGCGRTDLPGGDAEKLYESIDTKLKKLPKNTILYPGHNYDSKAHATLEKVAEINPFFRAEDS